jgi:serine/threonine protein phosphatase 1
MGLIAIGDVHGCTQSLNKLLEQLAPAPDDHLVFIGDYVDRGPDSKAVIERLLNLQNTHKCTFLRGNHEAYMLDYLDGYEADAWWVNGGLTTVNNYRSASGAIEFPHDHIEFLRKTVLYLDMPGYFFVHAGLKPNLTVKENMLRFGEEVFLWERSHLQARAVAWEKPVVFGHTPQSDPINRERMICIDTGCVYFTNPKLGRLTAVRLPDRDFISVEYAG